MTVKIQLPDEVEQTLREKADAAGVSTERYAQQVLERDLGVSSSDDGKPLAQPLRAVSEMILRRVQALPPEAFEGLPRDGASQHDHYIYGTPKRDDL